MYMRVVFAAFHAAIRKTQLELLGPCLQSLADRQFYAGYHFHEHKRLLTENIDSKLNGRHVLELTFPLNTETQVAMHTLLKRVAANVVACIQSLHCLGDTLSHAACYACGLNLNTPPLADRKITLRAVEEALAANPIYVRVGGALTELRKNPDFLYLSALVNHSKHRSIVAPRLHVDATGVSGQHYSLRFAAFQYDGKLHDARDVEAFLEPFYSWFSFHIVKCGNTLNAAL